MMILWCGFLLLTHFLCHVHPRECDCKYEYKDPEDPKRCCKKCAPGERMATRCMKDSDTVCKQCSPDFYMDVYSGEMECNRCSQCTKEHMEYKVKCSISSDAVCGCESGYKCSGNPCTDCEKVPTTAPPTTTTSTVMQAPTISQQPHLHVDGSCWLQLVVLGGPKKLLPNPVSAQRMRKCRCQSRRCVNINCGKRRFEGVRVKQRRRDKKRHIRVWLDYVL